MIIYILLSITFDKNTILPYATAFKTKVECEKAKATLEKEWMKLYNNGLVSCSKQKLRK